MDYPTQIYVRGQSPSQTLTTDTSPSQSYRSGQSCEFPPKLPKQLEEIPSAKEFPLFRHRWNSNEEVAALLTAFDKHKEWMSLEVKIRPPSGSMILYSRKRVRYKKDGYCWKKRKGGKNIREDHMKLKVQGVECIYGSYVHSDILPTFHRRCYWLLQNPDIVLIHYLNVPYPDDGKVKIPMMPCSAEKKEWTKEELVEQLRPMFSTGNNDHTLEETVERLVKHLIQYHESHDKSKGHNSGLKKPASNGDVSTTLDPASLLPSEDSECKDLLMNTVCQLNAKTQKSFTQQQHTGIIHIQPKANDVIPCSNNMEQAPLLLSVNQNSNYLLLRGGAETVTVTSGGQEPQLIPHQSLDQPIHHQPLQVPLNIPGQLNLFAHPNSNDNSPKPTMTYMGASSFITTPCQQNKGCLVPQNSANEAQNIIGMSYSINTSESFGNFQQALANTSNSSSNLTMVTSSENYSNFQQPLTFANSNTNDDFNNFHQTLVNSANSTLPLTTSEFNILDNLDFEISDIDKLYNDLNEQTESQKNKNNLSGDQDLTNEIDLFNSDLVQSCQGQNFSDISTICDTKTSDSRKDNKTEQRILDYSPDWAFTQGGEKILVVGPWCSLSSQYSCLFDTKPVPTSLIQPGVLRCFSPGHNEGVSLLQVSCDGHVISNSVPFKFVAKEIKEENKDDLLSFSDDELKLLLLERISVIQERLKKSSSYLSVQKLKEEKSAEQFEKKIVLFVKSLVSKPCNNSPDVLSRGRHGLTLLHLAAGLGCEALVHSLIIWRTEKSSWILNSEVDAQSLDDMGCSPMIWACAKGHRTIVQFLYQWNPESINILTKDGLSPLKVAQKFNKISIVKELSRLIGAGRDFINPAGEIDSTQTFSHPHDKMEQPNIFKVPTSVLGTLHIDIPDQSTQANNKSSASNRPQKKHSLSSGSSRRKLAKHFSIDCTPEDFNFLPPSHCERPVRVTNSEPRLCSVSDALTNTKNPMLCNSGRDLTSPDILINPEDEQKASLMDHSQTPTVHVTRTCVEMDTDADDMSDDFSSSAGSPYIDVERVSSDDEDRVTRIRTDRLSINGDNSEDAKRQMVNLAQQIIAAMPMRIKLSPSRVDDAAEFAVRERSSSYSSYSSVPSQPSPHASSYEEDSGISTPMGDGFSFDEYRYSDLGTPASSLNSPESTCPYSPYDFKLDSPPPTTEEFTEYFNAPATFMEKDFSLLTLSDQEQRKLYEAAKIIQKTYRKFRNKQQMTQQQKEMEAAVLIQKYYRRYKQYAYYKKMTQAAVLIQSQFRSYYAQKRFKKSRDAAVVIQNQYRTYKEHERLKKGGNKSVIIQQRYRSHYQRVPKHVGRNSDGQIVQIIPEGNDSTQADNTSDTSQLQDHRESPDKC